jgi:hypothetical protein
MDADPFSVFSPTFEGHYPVFFGKKGVVLSQSDIFTGMEPGPYLSHQDAAGLDNLTAKPFYSKTLTGAIPAVSGTSTGFFMCHD